MDPKDTEKTAEELAAEEGNNDEFTDEWAKLTADPAETDDDPDDPDLDVDDDDPEPEGVVRATGDDTPAEEVDPDEKEPEKDPETPEERITRLERENKDYAHKLQSETGRSAGLQQKLQEIRETSPGPSQEVIKEAMEDPKLWEEFKENYPEMSTSIESLVASEGHKIREDIKKEFAAVIQPLAQSEADRRRDSEIISLEEDHPDWKAVSESPAFWDWVGAQPDKIQEMGKSSNAADAAYLLTQFKLSTGEPSTPDPDPDPGQDDEANKLQRKRELQKKTGVTVPSTTQAAPRSGELTPDGGDFSTAFQIEARKREKKLQDQGRL